ncbi:hypothetical protein GGR57DRAFT_221466 [Xylariaceae sp. FL1272]|nr:hypothetical protein GGR57DRAFT_221466 [Xylariaceae sp. FL1272]
MPRTLPWKRREQDALKETNPLPVKRVKKEPKSPLGGYASDQRDVKSAPKPHSRQHRRVASSSPPPTPGPLLESFMVDGLDEDDRYRMVEDEFLATAQLYTSHLHAAEYRRLKNAARAQNAQTIRDISRPVAGERTDIVRLKQERKERQKQQQIAVREVRSDEKSASKNGGEGSDDSSGSVEDKNLHGLLEAPRKRNSTTRLDGLIANNPVTRAAAGYTRQSASKLAQAPSEQSIIPKRPTLPEIDDDGLDASIGVLGREGQESYGQKLATREITAAKGGGYSKQQQIHNKLTATKTTTTTTQSSVSSSLQDKDSQAADDDGLDFMTRWKQKQAKHRRNREERKSGGISNI